MSPQQQLQSDWPWIMRHFKKSLLSTGFYSFATINEDGSAHVAPYASLILNEDCSGYYSDIMPNRMSRNLVRDPRICLMAVYMGKGFWFRSLLKGRFDQWPGLRLFGTVEKSRKARPGEIEQWRKRVKRYQWMKGYDLLWRDVSTVRDIHFTHYEPIQCGRMSAHLTKR